MKSNVLVPIIILTIVLMSNSCSRKPVHYADKKTIQFEDNDSSVVPVLIAGDIYEKAEAACYLFNNPQIDSFTQDVVISVRKTHLNNPNHRSGPYSDLFKFTAWYLGQYGSYDSIPHLTECLHDPNWVVKASAASGLSMKGHLAVRALPDLVLLLRDRMENVRASALDAVFSIDNKPSKYIVHIIRMLNEEEEWSVRVKICKYLGAMGPDGYLAVATLEKYAGEPYNENWAKEALSEIIGK